MSYWKPRAKRKIEENKKKMKKQARIDKRSIRKLSIQNRPLDEALKAMFNPLNF